MTHILEIILLAVGVVGCIVVGLTVVLIFNINLKTFGETKDNKIPPAETRRPDGGFFISS